MTLEDNCGCATQPGEFTIAGDHQTWRGTSQHQVFNFSLNDGTKARPRGGNVARYENNFGSERGSNEPKAAAKAGSLPGKCFDRGGISFF
jgi:hypothetical protein